MNIKKTVVRLGIIITTGLALALGGVAPSAQAQMWVYDDGYVDCGLSSGRRVSASATATAGAEAWAGGAYDYKGGSAGWYQAIAKSGKSQASWWNAASPTRLAGGGSCSV